MYVMRQEIITGSVTCFFSSSSDYSERLQIKSRPFARVGNDYLSDVDQLPMPLRASLPIIAGDLAKSFIKQYSI